MKVPSAVRDVLHVAAPTLLTALGGPLGGLAAALASAALAEWLPRDSAGEPLPPSPETVTATVAQNADKPNFILALKRAEAELQRYEMEANFRFAELAAKDRQSSREFQAESQIAQPLMRWGMGIVVVTIGCLLAIVVGCLLMVAGVVLIPPDQAQIAVGVFGLVGAITGYLAGYGNQVLSFYFGSSNGEKAQRDTTADTLRDMGSALGEAVKQAPKPAPAPAPPVVVVPPAPAQKPEDETVAPSEWRQGPYGGARWRLTREGIILEGESKPRRTVGEPVTIRRIWRDFGPAIMEVATRYAVPAELVVSVIATESKGNPDAILREPDGRASGGLMQVLNTTASEILGRQVTAEDLRDIRLNIEAGVAYIAHQKPITGFDPILTAAAYNAGGLYEPRAQDSNPFRLRSTGDHLMRMLMWWNDTAFVAREDDWFGTRKAAA